MKIFIDFDGVLFNTGQMRDELFEILKNENFSFEEINQAYVDECADGNYRPDGHLKRLAEIHSFDQKLALNKIDQLIKNCKKYLFFDTIEVLGKLSKKYDELILLTLGDSDFQMAKIEACDISKYFSQVLDTQIPKWQFLQNIVDQNEEFIVLDDRDDNLIKIQEHFPKSKVVKMVRDEKYHDPAGHFGGYSGEIVRGLEEFYQLLDIKY